ncbi:NAD(P)/FAD-dependent oxidoreductase [Rhizobium mesoamericanum]|uniref:FAD dependent oxidoreductase n=1 Tax=Rhizobium mesoamericanum STM3625 TaxID=1211777 RepID=K0Q3L7_9HYPH|nr:FAD-binding oxidoreductase [Rhizobium mesoamericanum]CCM77319.1 FAD dependent oxidoreductase [Rhizobium mesoamericanum STM3625]
MAAKQHVVVVGSGIVGASIAWHLARDGAAVTVIAEDVGGVATRHSFAWINASWGNPQFYFHFRRRSMAEWKRLAHEIPGLPLSWCGGICWDLPPDRLEAFAVEHASWGYGVEWLDRAAITAREPYLRQLPDSALLVAEEGAVEPVAAARLLLADAEARGAKFVNAAVDGFIRSGERISGVVSSAGIVEADHVVLATGAGSVPLAASVGVTLPLEAPPGLIVHSRPFEKRLNGLVMATSLHMRQTTDSRIIAGSDFGGPEAGTDQYATAVALFAKVKESLTESGQLSMEFFTVGYRPTPKDGLPIIGNCGQNGLYIAVMHSGVTLAPLVGLLASKEILSGDADPSLASFRLGRFR